MRYIILFTLLIFSLQEIKSQKLSKKEIKFWNSIKKNDINMVRQILKKKVNPNVKYQNNYTPIYWALQEENYEIAKLLIQYKAKINAPIYQNIYTPYKATLLILSCLKNSPKHHRITKFLLDHQAKHDITVKSKNSFNGFSALEIAISNHNDYATILLIKQGANVNRVIRAENPFFNQFTPLGIALNQGIHSEVDQNIVKLLLKHGANINHQILFQNGNRISYEVLFCSIKHQYPVQHIAQLMQKAGANFKQNIKLSNYEGKLFPFAAKYNSTNTLKALRACQLNINSQVIKSVDKNEIGFTALHFAVQKRNKAMIKYLLSQGADTTIKSANHKTAFELVSKADLNNLLPRPKKTITQRDIPTFNTVSWLHKIKQSSGNKKIDLLHQLGQKLTDFLDTQKAEKILRQALTLSKSSNYIDGIATSYQRLSALYYKMALLERYTTKRNENINNIEKKYTSKIMDSLDFLQRPNKLDYKKKEAKNNIFNINKIDQTLFHPALKHPITIHICRNKIQNEYWQKYQSYKKRSAEIRIKQGNEDKQVWGIKHLIELHQFEENSIAIQEKLYLKWLNIRSKSNQKTKKLWALKGIIAFYITHNEHQKAKPYIQEVCKIYEETTPRSIIHFFMNLANFCSKQHSEKEASKNANSFDQNPKLAYLQEAVINIPKYIPDEESQNNFYLKISKYYKNHIQKNSKENISDKILSDYSYILLKQNDPILAIKGHFLIADRSKDQITRQHYLEKIENLLPKITDKTKRRTQEIRYANYYAWIRNYPKALEIKILNYEQKRLTLLEAKNPIEEMIWRKVSQAHIKKSIQILNNFLETHHQSHEKIWAYRGKSQLYQSINRYEKCIEAYSKILEISEKMSVSPRQYARDLADMGFFYQLSKDKIKASSYFHKALRVTQKHKTLKSQIHIYELKIAYCYDAFNVFNKSEKSYLQAYKSIQKILRDKNKTKSLDKRDRDLGTAHMILMRISKFYLKYKKKKKALKYAISSLNMAKRISNKYVYNKASKFKKSNILINQIHSN